jgi:hypothetical protein
VSSGVVPVSGLALALPVSQSRYAAGVVKGPIYDDSEGGEGEGDGEDGFTDTDGSSVHTPTEHSLLSTPSQNITSKPPYTSTIHTSTSTHKPASKTLQSTNQPNPPLPAAPGHALLVPFG